MVWSLVFINKPTRRARKGGARRARWSLGAGMLLLLSANVAGAAALGSLTASVGLLGTLAALFVIKGLPSHMPVSTLTTAAAALLIAAGGAAWLWRMRGGARVAALAGGPAGRRARVASPTRTRRTTLAAIVLPAGFQHDSLLEDMRRHFIRLQRAWDNAETGELRELTTPEMLEELRLGLPASMSSVRADCTEVVTLRAELLGFESLEQVFVASVEFSGLIRESAGAGAVPFRELWLLTRARPEPAVWRLARHQALI